MSGSPPLRTCSSPGERLGLRADEDEELADGIDAGEDVAGGRVHGRGRRQHIRGAVLVRRGRKLRLHELGVRHED